MEKAHFRNKYNSTLQQLQKKTVEYICKIYLIQNLKGFGRSGHF